MDIQAESLPKLPYSLTSMTAHHPNLSRPLQAASKPNPLTIASPLPLPPPYLTGLHAFSYHNTQNPKSFPFHGKLRYLYWQDIKLRRENLGIFYLPRLYMQTLLGN